MNAVNPRKMEPTDLTSVMGTPGVSGKLVNYPMQITKRDKWSSGAIGATMTFTMSGIGMRGLNSNPHGNTPMVYLVGAGGACVICTNGKVISINDDANPESHSDTLIRTGTNGNYGGQGEPAAPPDLIDAFVDPSWTWTVLIEPQDNDTCEITVSSNAALYDSVTWELTSTDVYTHAGVFAAPVTAWFGAMSPTAVKAFKDVLANEGEGPFTLNHALNNVTIVTQSDTANVVPVITAFTIPATHTGLTVEISSWTHTDGDGTVTAWYLSETNSLVGATWLTEKPTEFTFAAAGEKTLYAWVRDNLGGVSTMASDTCTVSES